MSTRVYARPNYDPWLREGENVVMLPCRADNAARTYWWLAIAATSLPLKDSDIKAAVVASAEAKLGHAIQSNDVVILP